MPECKVCNGTGTLRVHGAPRCGACDGYGRVDEWPEMIAKNFAIAAPIGTDCLYFPTKPFDRSQAIKTKIRSKPWILGSGAIVVAIECMSGGKSIEHIAFEQIQSP